MQSERREPKRETERKKELEKKQSASEENAERFLRGVAEPCYIITARHWTSETGVCHNTSAERRTLIKV
jgi:hypothetical protein